MFVRVALVATLLSACTGEPIELPPVDDPAAMPVVFAVPATAPRGAITRARADALLAGETEVRVVGSPEAHTYAGGRIESAVSATRALGVLASDPDAIAVVAARDVGPDVRVLRVGGVDPLREPASYPFLMKGRASRVTTVTVVGDVMLARRVGTEMEARDDFRFPFRLVAHRLRAADLTLANLETTLARLGPPTQGDAFAADPRSLAGVSHAGIDVLSLANNHTGDFGPRSLVRTLEHVERAGIRAVGAGGDAGRARRAVIVRRGGLRIGLLGFNAIGETPEAGPARPGAVRLRMQPRLGSLNDADLAAMTDAVRALSVRADIVIVLPHWGAQYTHRAHPDQRTVARALVRAGADAVIGSHPHWVQGMELIGDAVLVHSLGNFVFDMDLAPQTREGIALELTFWGSSLKAARPSPIVIDDDWRPRFVRGARARSILADVWRASRGPFRLN